MEQEIDENDRRLPQAASKKVPRIFTLFGGFVKRFSWFGYLLAAVAVAVSLAVIVRDFKLLALTDTPGYFITISAWFWLSLGLVKFSKEYAQAINEGNRNAILSFILLLAVFCLLAGVTAFYRSMDWLVFAIAVLIFAVSLLTVILLSFGLIYHWNRLEGGIHIYDE
jgi:hypothetical protein